MQTSKLVEIEWDFEDFDANWNWCVEHATFKHKEACEFIVYCGDPEYVEFISKEMIENGCTLEFVGAYRTAAKEPDAQRVLFWK
jgi:uridine phosphorylase